MRSNLKFVGYFNRLASAVAFGLLFLAAGASAQTLSSPIAPGKSAPPGIDLPAGKTDELKPGGMHLMLMDLKQALTKDSTIPVTLMFKDKAGKDLKMEIKVPVSARAPVGAGTSSPHQMDHHNKH